MNPAATERLQASGLAKVIPLRPVSALAEAGRGQARNIGNRVASVRTLHPAVFTPPRPQSVLDRTVSFLADRLAGRYQIDEYGYDPHVLREAVFPALRPLTQRWLRVTVSGAHHLPVSGGGLIVANHAGAFPVDGLITQLAVHDHHPVRRIPRVLAANLVMQAPVLGAAARKAGHVGADEQSAHRLLRAGELALAFPEGVRGASKPFTQRYQVRRFGNDGYAGAALRAGVPIIPCAITGSGESYPKLGDIDALAKLLGLPYFPVTPLFPHFGLLGLLPLPAKWHIEFGEPIDTAILGTRAANESAQVSRLSGEVRTQIQGMLPSGQ